jgi:hypothetical protein
MVLLSWQPPLDGANSFILENGIRKTSLVDAGNGKRKTNIQQQGFPNRHRLEY